MKSFNPQDYGALKRDVEYLIKCCDEMRNEVASIRSRNAAILTSVVLLLIGIVINLALSYAK